MKLNDFFLSVFSLLFSGLTSYAQTPLEGIWLRPCLNKGAAHIQIFTGLKNRADDLFYEDLNCTVPAMTFINIGHFKIQDQQIDYEFESVSIVLYTDRLVKSYNDRAVCGKSDWEKNSITVITGLRCALFQENYFVQVPKAGDKRFGIWKIEEDSLFFGALSQQENGSTPEKRPTAFDLRPYFKQR